MRISIVSVQGASPDASCSGLVMAVILLTVSEPVNTLCQGICLVAGWQVRGMGWLNDFGADVSPLPF